MKMPAPGAPGAPGPAPAALRPADAIAMYAALALGTGLACAGVLAFRREVQQEFTWSGPDTAWMTPLSYLVFYGSVFLPGIALWRVAPRRSQPVLLTALLIFTSAFALLSVAFGDGLHSGARLLLALGVAVQGSRLVSARLDRVCRYARSVTGILLGVVAVAAALAVGLQPWRAHRRLAASAPPANRPPNVLLLVLDTVRASALSLYGYDKLTTPQLERWASRGVVFDYAFSGAPWTLPSHGTLFTGRPYRELSVGWLKPLDNTHRVLAEAFAAAGYRTAGVSANYVYVSEETGLARGFDLFVSHPRTVRQLLLSSVPGQMLLGLHLGRYDREREADRMEAYWARRRVQQWILADRSRPWFAFVNFFDAHQPYLTPVAGTATLGHLRTNRDRYSAAIWSIDREIGALLEALEAEGMLDNTVVVVTADHGEQFGEHGLRGHSNSLYAPLLRVPLLILGPGVRQGLRVPTPVSLEDVPATLQRLTGLGGARFPGESFATCWQVRHCGRKVPDTLTAALQGRPPALAGGAGIDAPLVAIMVNQWHYIRNVEGQEKLYDLRQDPRERRDLASDSTLRAVLVRLRASADAAELPAPESQAGGR